MPTVDFWGLLGIIVSLVLFLIGYRQTVGAKKERVASANQEVEKILVRRIVLESYAPDVTAVTRLLEGKARDFRVRPEDLLAEEQMLNSIFTRILETDFLPQDKREEILKRLVPLIIQAEKGPSTEEAIETAESSPQRLLTRTIALGIAASIAGTLVAGFPKIVNIDTEFPKLFSAMLATAVASLAIISALIGFYRVRESQQETSTKADTLSSLMTFEREVVDLFTSVGARIQASTTTAGYDLNVDHNGRKILVEIKAWKRPMPVRLIALVVEQLRQAVESEHAAEGIIVIARSMRFPREIIGQGIKIMTLPELRNYLAHVQQK